MRAVWEYDLREILDESYEPEEIVSILDDWGSEGWEIFHLIPTQRGTTYWLKRQREVIREPKRNAVQAESKERIVLNSRGLPIAHLVRCDRHQGEFPGQWGVGVCDTCNALDASLRHDLCMLLGSEKGLSDREILAGVKKLADRAKVEEDPCTCIEQPGALCPKHHKGLR